MPNINDVFPSKFLKAHELHGHEPIVTIERVEFEQVGSKRETVPVVYFVGKDKGIRLNKTIANKIIEISGTAITEEWRGVRVRLYATEATFAGESYDVVRVKSPNGSRMSRMSRMTPAPPPPKLPEPEPIPDDVYAGELTDDEIPFAWVLPLLVPALGLIGVFA